MVSGFWQQKPSTAQQKRFEGNIETDENMNVTDENMNVNLPLFNMNDIISCE